MLKRIAIFSTATCASALLLAACGDGGAPGGAAVEPGDITAEDDGLSSVPGGDLAAAEPTPPPLDSAAPYDPLQDYGEPGARADFEFAGGEQGSGTAWFFETPEGMRVYVLTRGMNPGARAIHIHETGDCSAPDFATAGDHLGMDAGRVLADKPDDYEAGGLPDITVAADGQGELNALLEVVTFTEDTAETWPLFDADGAAIVIHRFATPDLPPGEDNPRLACGEIFESDL